MKHRNTATTRKVTLASRHICTIAMALLVGLFVAGIGLRVHAQAPVSAVAGVEWPEVELSTHITGLDRPAHVTHAGDGSGRLFIVEQLGRIRIFHEGVLLPAPFLDINERVRCCGERGLLSVAFPADYVVTGFFYVNYTDKTGQTIVARYGTSANANLADPGSEQVLLTIHQPYGNHNGGQLAFSPIDGYLYIGMGDGGSAGDPLNKGQDTASLLGKMLRIDVSPSANPYLVPPTNPYTQTAGYRDEIWALGLRNPWRFSFDALTGDLYIADVGQGEWEEIDYQPASSPGGENYGWRIMEGAHCYEPVNCDTSGLVLPIAEYDHSLGCSVTGGVVYRGQLYPRMQGIYLYGDYCSGRVWGLRRQEGTWQNALLVDTPHQIVSFGRDEAGYAYLVDYGGTIYRLEDNVMATPTPTATQTSSPTNQPTSTTTLPSPSRTLTPTSSATPASTPSPTVTAYGPVHLPVIVKW
jgi:glucose/arabinose dehydrogenase